MTICLCDESCLSNKQVTYLIKTPPELIEISFERQFNATDLISYGKGTLFWGISKAVEAQSPLFLLRITFFEELRCLF